MTDMRRLAHLLRHANQVVAKSGGKELEGVDLLHRKNYHTLMQAIFSYTNVNGVQKANLLVALSYLLRNAANIIMCEFLVVMEDDKAHEIELFLHVLKTRWQLITKQAMDSQYIRSQEVLRKPLQLPSEDNLIKLRTYITSRVNTLTQNSERQWSLTEFIELRDLLTTRLTLFNARRGGEVARMFLKQWHDAEKGAWVDPRVTKTLDDSERLFVGKYKLGYMRGKGRIDVSVMFPEDTVPAVRVFVKARSKLQAQDEVRPDNVYLFPSTRGSPTHVGGNYSMQRVCRDAGVTDTERIIGGKNEVTINTKYDLL